MRFVVVLVLALTAHVGCVAIDSIEFADQAITDTPPAGECVVGEDIIKTVDVTPECIGRDGAYCEWNGLMNGACVCGECVSCSFMTCQGVRGCTSDEAFAHNGNIGNACPAGCYSSCAL